MTHQKHRRCCRSASPSHNKSRPLSPGQIAGGQSSGPRSAVPARVSASRAIHGRDSASHPTPGAVALAIYWRLNLKAKHSAGRGDASGRRAVGKSGGRAGLDRSCLSLPSSLRTRCPTGGFQPRTFVFKLHLSLRKTELLPITTRPALHLHADDHVTATRLGTSRRHVLNPDNGHSAHCHPICPFERSTLQSQTRAPSPDLCILLQF